MSGRAQRQVAEQQSARRKQLAWLGAAVVAALAVALVLILFNRPRSPGAPIAAAPLPASIPLDGTRMGADTAKVSVVEWGDYQCHWCGIFAREMAPNLVKDYVEPGLVTFEFHDFAFIGPESVRAAEAAACANDQGAFWPYHDTLYQNQRGENLQAFNDDRLKSIAASLSLDPETFNRCLDSGAKQAAVDKSSAEARQKGIDSTPTIFVNGTEVPWQWETLKPAIDAALAKE